MSAVKRVEITVEWTNPDLENLTAIAEEGCEIGDVANVMQYVLRLIQEQEAHRG